MKKVIIIALLLTLIPLSAFARSLGDEYLMTKYKDNSGQEELLATLTLIRKIPLLPKEYIKYTGGRFFVEIYQGELASGGTIMCHANTFKSTVDCFPKGFVATLDSSGRGYNTWLQGKFYNNNNYTVYDQRTGSWFSGGWHRVHSQ